MRKPRGKYTKDKIIHRRSKQEERQNHIKALEDGNVVEELPEPLFPGVFTDIQELYWEKLKLIYDPRSSINSVYPLYLILHRIIAGFIAGNQYIGVLFPKKRQNIEPGKRKLGALPTRGAVYRLLRRIDWIEANAILAPLWERLGHTPDLVVHRTFRDPRKILDEFKEEGTTAQQIQGDRIAQKREAEERSTGMSAAKAKNPGSVSKKERVGKKVAIKKGGKNISVLEPIKILHNLVIDGKVVKASYNSGVTERFVHVTEIKLDEKEDRSRFIIGAQPTVLDRKGEWGAALSILDALTPLPDDRVVLISGDAGFCVEEFCHWLTEKGFFLHLSDQGKRR